MISDLGTEAPHQLVCTTDRKPCCQHPVQYGEWYFSDGQQVKHISEGAVEFQRDRDDNGNVYLYRVGTDQTPDGGKFCCRVQDATDINQTLCVNIGKINSTPLQHTQPIIIIDLVYIHTLSGNLSLTVVCMASYTCP